jgi:hypothetical protein
VLSKCAHPVCFAQFRYLRLGKVFKVRMPVLTDRSGEYRVEYFWLCENCAQAFKVVLKDGAVMTVPLHLQLKAGETETGARGDSRMAA